MSDYRSKLMKPWVLGTVIPAVIIILGLIIKPDLFYDRFIWKYFYGPVVADATTQEGCITRNGVEACAGYTLVSEAGYVYVLAVSVIGVVDLLKHLDVGNSPDIFFGLVPYAFVGGALRVVEDTGMLEWPINFFFISPIIYFTMFFVTLALFIISIWFEKEGYVDTYAKPLALFGVAWLIGLLTTLFYYGVTQAQLILWVPVATFVMATAVWAVVWFGIKTFASFLNKGTGTMGAVLLWGHLVDASATTVGIEFLGYGEKHPVVEAIIQTTGTTFAFIPVKAAAVILILYLFDENSFKEFPRLSHLLLVAVLAVGLGPGTRDFLRATIGV